MSSSIVSAYYEYDHHLPSRNLSRVASRYSKIDCLTVDAPVSKGDALYFRLDGSHITVNGQRIEEDCIAALSQLTPNTFTSDGRQKIWMIDFYRGMLSRLLRVDVRRQTARFLSWDHIPWLRDLARELRLAPDDQTRIKLCDEALALAASRMLDDSPVEAAVYHINQSRALVSVDELASTIGVSRRKLERAFAARLRVSPNVELRAHKFHRTIAQWMANPSLGWKDLEFAPYVDQSHFIKEAKFFLGSTPRNKLRSNEHEQHRFHERGATKELWNGADTPDLPDWNAHLSERLNYLALCAGTASGYFSAPWQLYLFRSSAAPIAPSPD